MNSRNEKYILDEQVEHRQTIKRQKRIEKHKKKLIMMKMFQNQKQGSKVESTNTCLSVETNSKIQFKHCDIRIPRSMKTMLQFLFSGFINVEIAEAQAYYLVEEYGIKIQSVEKHHCRFSENSCVPTSNSFYYSTSHFPFEFSKQYDIAIHLLESSQNIQSYALAQKLRTYKLISESHCDLALRFQSDLKSNRIRSINSAVSSGGRKQFQTKELGKLEEDRREYRNKLVNKFITEKFQKEEGEFFFCCDGGVSLESGAMMPSKFRVSASVFALMGIDESNIQTFLMRSDIFFRMVPFHSRKRLTIEELKIRIGGGCSKEKNFIKQQNTDPGTGFNELQLNDEIIRDFEILTIDDIPIVCDVVISTSAIIYPDNLRLNTESDDQVYALWLNHMDKFQCVQFKITCIHLDQILRIRSNRVGFNESASMNSFVEDLEYSIMSSIFLEKFYKKEVAMTMKSDVSEEVLSNCQEQIIKKNKRCGYRETFFCQ